MKKIPLIFMLFSFPFAINFLIAQEQQETKEKTSLEHFSSNPFVNITGIKLVNPEEPRYLKLKDPYKIPNSHWKKHLEESENYYCGIKINEHTSDYQLETFKSKSVLFDRGFHITHKGSCGTCSSVQDLKVYLERPNLTSPVRKCAALSFRWPIMQCLLGLGFSKLCVETWYYNIAQTRRKCSLVCLKSWWKNESFNGQDGGLNTCLECDENESGPAFKVTAGRTRRRSGIVSAIKRKEQEFFRLKHDYLEMLDSDK